MAKQQAMKTAMDTAVYDYMVRQFGGEEGAYRALCKARLRELSGVGVQQIREQAEREGWLSTLDTMTPAQVAAAAAPSGAPKTASGRSKRLTSAESSHIRTAAVSYIQQNPGARKAAIADAIGCSVGKLGPQLLRLKKAGEVVQQGTRGSTRYVPPSPK